MDRPVQDIHIVALAEEWPAIRDDPRFIELMRLARVANSLSLAYPGLLAPLSDQSPRARRDRFAAFFHAAALLKEGLPIAEGLGRWYRDHPQYRNGFTAIFRDPVAQVLRSHFLDRVRNELVFHFDRDPIITGLSRLPGGEVIIGSYPESGPKYGDVYFDIADDAVLGYLFGDAETDEDYLARLEGFMLGVSKLMNQFLVASHRLIAAGIVGLGCRKRRAERPIEPD